MSHSVSYSVIQIVLEVCVFWQVIRIILLAVITSLVAQVPNLNPYRWPGWFVVAAALVYALVVVLLFRETRQFALPKHCKTCSCAREMKLSAQLSSKWHIHLIVSILHCVARCFNNMPMYTVTVCMM